MISFIDDHRAVYGLGASVGSSGRIRDAGWLEPAQTPYLFR